MDPARCGGDICIQACANDPQVAVHAIRNLARVGFGTAAVRYSQLGFGRTSSTTRGQSTPRNLFGFKDGTNNLKAEETDTLNKQVWVADGDGPDWLTGRHLPGDAPDPDADRIMGPHNTSRAGAGDRPRRRAAARPWACTDEFDELNFDLKNDKGKPADRRIRPRPTGLTGTPEQRDRDPAPRLQLHRRHGRFRASRRRAVLHRVRAQPRHAVHPDADRTVAPGCCSTSTSPTPVPRCSRFRRDCARATTTPTGVRRCSAESG